MEILVTPFIIVILQQTFPKSTANTIRATPQENSCRVPGDVPDDKYHKADRNKQHHRIELNCLQTALASFVCPINPP